jgi:hypothetical protein
MYARAGAGPPAMVTFFQKAMPTGPTRVLGHADASDRAAGSSDLEGGHDRLLEADALEDGIDAEPARELANTLHRFLAALADDVRRAELARQRDPVRTTAEHDDLRGAKPLGGDNAAQPDRAVTYDSDGFSRRDLCAQGGVVPGAHHVCQREQ